MSTEFIAALVAALAAMSASHHVPTPAPTVETVESVPATPASAVTQPAAEATLIEDETESAPTLTQIPFASAPTTAQADATHLATDPRIEQVLQLVNTERSHAGCRSVQLDPRLTKAALLHSQDMAKRHYFNHNSPDGSSPADRVSSSGYAWSSTGENIAAGYKTPLQVMNGWMKSEGHRKNILNCGFRDMGLGVVELGYNAPYWTQEFGRTSNDKKRPSASR